MPFAIILSMCLLFSSLSFAKGDSASSAKDLSLGSSKETPVIHEEDLDTLVTAMNDYLKEGYKYRADTEMYFRIIRRELLKLKQQGLLKEDFDPRRLSDDELGDKIRKLQKSAEVEVAGPSVSQSIVHTTLVCVALLTGKCPRLPELKYEPAPITIQSSGSK